jgi:putative oxidoreductase
MRLERAADYRQYAGLVLRVVIGIFFVLHGLDKFGIFGEGGFGDATRFFAQLKMPAPHITAPILAIVETLSGLALIFGVLARLAAIALAAVVTVEIIVVKLPQSINPFASNGYLFELTLFLALIALALLGPGAYALDE